MRTVGSPSCWFFSASPISARPTHLLSAVNNSATVDPQLLLDQWPTVFALLLGLVTFKSTIISTASLGFGLSAPEAAKTGLILSGGNSDVEGGWVTCFVLCMSIYILLFLGIRARSIVQRLRRARS